MAKRRYKFTFLERLITEPLIYQLGREFDVVTNIRRAVVDEDMGWVVLELDGDKSQISSGVDWIVSKGVRVDPVGGDVVEG